MGSEGKELEGGDRRGGVAGWSGGGGLSLQAAVRTYMRHPPTKPDTELHKR